MNRPAEAMDPDLLRALQEQHMRDRRFRFWYFVPHPDQDLRESTPFMAFTSGILLTAPLFGRALEWPIDVREPFASREAVLRARTSGIVELQLTPVEYSAFTAIALHLHMPLRCVISDQNSCDWVDAQIAGAPIPWMHLSTVPAKRRIPLRTANDDHFVAYAARVRDALRAAGRDEGVSEWLDITLSGKRSRAVRKVACPDFEHNTTAPNFLALRANRLTTSTTTPLQVAAPSRYVSAIIRSAEVVAEQRRQMLENTPWAKPPTDLALCVESVTWEMYRGTFDQLKVPGKISRRDWRRMMKAARRPQTFIHTLDPKQVNEEALRMLFGLRAQEMRAFTMAMALQNSSTLTPVVRLEPRLNKVRGSLTQIGSCARGNSTHREFKLRKMCRELGTQMSAYVSPEFLRFLEGYRNRICGMNLVSDLPLEWMKVSGNRLTLRHDVSRLPVTPGSLLFGHCTSAARQFVRPEDFREILVIRSFLPGDRLRTVLERALTGRKQEEGAAVIYRFVDVASPEELVAALREYSGAIMIFDGHGQRDPETGAGKIVIGGEPVDLWKYREELKIPPIVLLSACDTLPLDGSHGSSAVGLLALGATTVLATLLPIHAVTAAQFLARLTLRIETFIPVALNLHPHGFDWRMMMAGMLRMVHMTELLKGLVARGVLPEECYEEVHLLGNMHINSRNPNWFELVRSAILDRSQRPEHEVVAAIEDAGSMTDALKYVQIGRPELITVVRETASQAIHRLDPQNMLDLPMISPFNFVPAEGGA